MGRACLQANGRPTHAKVQRPRDFDKAGLTLIKKVAELSCKLGGHALATFADDSRSLHYYTSSTLQRLVVEVEQQFPDFLQHSVLSDVMGVSPSSATLFQQTSVMSHNRLRRGKGLKLGTSACPQYSILLKRLARRTQTEPSWCTCSWDLAPPAFMPTKLLPGSCRNAV